MVHMSRAALGRVFVVRVIVGICWRRRARSSSGRLGVMKSSGTAVVHGACLLARRSRPTEAGELAGRVRRYLKG